MQARDRAGDILIKRYNEKRTELVRFSEDGTDPGEIAEILETGDRHLLGEAAARITTTRGCVLYYKPRDCRSTELCGKLTELLFGRSMVPEQITGAGYAFQKAVPAVIPAAEEDKRVFYRQMGKLTALFYALGSTDMHKGNVICSAEGPVVLDTETLLCARVRGMGGAGEFSADYGEVFPDLGSCVGECMVLPRFYGFMQTSPLVVSGLSRPEGWEACFTEGFSEGCRRIRLKRDEIRALLEQYAQAPFRYLLRSTASYSAMILLYRDAGDDAARAAVLKKLEKGLSGEDLVRYEPLLAWERQGIQNGDIPYFCVLAGSRGVCARASDQPLIRDYLEQTPIRNALMRIDRFSREDLEVQRAYIRASLNHIDGWETVREEKSTAGTDRDRQDPPEDTVSEALSVQEAVREAEYALQKLWEERIPLSGGCCLWHMPMIRGRIGSMFGLFEGFAGVSVFVGACARSGLITGRARRIARELSHACFQDMAVLGEYLLADYSRPPEERAVIRRFDGGFDFTEGLAGLLWALRINGSEDPERVRRICRGFGSWGIRQIPETDALSVLLSELPKPADHAGAAGAAQMTDCLYAGRALQAAALLKEADPQAAVQAGRILKKIRDNRERNGQYRVFAGKRHAYFLPAFLGGSTGIAYIMLRYAAISHSSDS